MDPLIATTLMLHAALAAPPRLVEGKPDSPVRVVIYEDLACSDCAVFRRMMDEHLLPKYGAKVAFEHRDFPLVKHPWARPAAIAGRFFEQTNAELAVRWRREVLNDRRKITPESLPDYLQAFAKRNGVDGAKALAALHDAQLQASVERDYQEGVARGIARTPTVLVNGEPYIETFALEEISKGIDAALKENGIQ
jgi:protein-disulfide isomerase